MFKHLNKHVKPAVIAVTAILLTTAVVTVYASVLPRPFNTPQSIALSTTGNHSTESVDDERDENGSNVTGKTTVKTDAASSASLKETNGSTDTTGTGTTVPGVDAAASASITTSTPTDAGTTEPTPIDAVASASVPPTVPTDPTTAGTAAPAPVDAVASASQPQPGSTTAAGAPAGTSATIPLTQAQAIAVSAVGGTAQVKESETESEHGVLVYKIKLVQSGKEIEVMVQASTGAILEVEQD